jgi:heme-degrading monooxygenase HmoA
MYRIVWEYSVRAEAVEKFKRIYGAEGAWIELFKRSPDYVGTDLYSSVNDPNRYITVDRWRTRTGYEQFRKANATDYAALDDSCETLLAHERTLGVTEDGKE